MDFVSLLNSHFGLAPLESLSLESLTSGRVLLMGCFLTGNLVWMGYQAFITSDLAVRRAVLPFRSLEQLLKTDFK